MLYFPSNLSSSKCLWTFYIISFKERTKYCQLRLWNIRCKFRYPRDQLSTEVRGASWEKRPLEGVGTLVKQRMPVFWQSSCSALIVFAKWKYSTSVEHIIIFLNGKIFWLLVEISQNLILKNYICQTNICRAESSPWVQFSTSILKPSAIAEEKNSVGLCLIFNVCFVAE